MRYLFLLSGLFTIAGSAVATAQDPDSGRRAGVIRTSGRGSVTVPPDLATVTVQFSASGRTPRIAGQAAARRANAIRGAIAALGISPDSLPTGGRWGWWGARSQMVVGPYRPDTTYVTTDVFTVRIRDLAMVGRVIDTALVQGAQTISNIEFTATETRAAHREALQRATTQARENAEAMAHAANTRLGRLIELSTDPPSYRGEDPFLLTGITVVGAASSSTTIVAPEIKVSVTVYARWELPDERRP